MQMYTHLPNPVLSMPDCTIAPTLFPSIPMHAPPGCFRPIVGLPLATASTLNLLKICLPRLPVLCFLSSVHE
eukprot:1642892-Ditylum_brightwellii.AAC.1